MSNRTLLNSLYLLLVFLIPIGAFAQSGVLKGTVADANGEPLIGVNIVIEGTTTGTVSDYMGNYTLEQIPNEAVNLVASFIGYLTETYAVDFSTQSEQTLNIVLIEDIEELSEVVVIGYGTQKKSDLTGAVASVTTEDLQKIPTPNIETALQGQVAGVRVSAATGAPGASKNVTIRGVSSINGSAPLWIVDGVPADPNSVNMADVESMEILKDASTAAIYGSAGSNGVILITTKSGKEGKIEVSANAYYGVQQVAKTIDMANGQEIAHHINEYQLVEGVRASKLDFTDYTAIDTLPNYNYLDDIFRIAPIQSYDISVAKGSEKGSSYMGVGYFQQDGIVYNTDYKRLNIRINSEYKPRDWFEMGENVSFSTSETNGFDEWDLKSEYRSPIRHAVGFLPYMPLYDTAGNYMSDGKGNANPQATVDHTSNKNRLNYRGQASVYARIKPIEGLTFETRMTGDLNVQDNKSFTDIYEVFGTTQRSNRTSINRGQGRGTGWNWQNILSYNSTVMEDYNLSAMAGMEAKHWYDHYFYGTRRDLMGTNEEMWYPDASLDNAADTADVPTDKFYSGSGSEYSAYAYFGRFSADYKGRYLFQFNLRYDGSSRFGPEHRYGMFPGFSTGWKFSEEAFMANFPWLNFGKVRYGWGQAGVDNIAPYGFYTTVSPNETLDYSFNNGDAISLGASPTQLVNRQVHWETVTTSNFGIDLRMLDSRLSVTADYFKRTNNEMLIRVETPTVAGWFVQNPFQEGGEAIAYSNAGKLENKGVELSLGWKHQLGELKYDVQTNFTYVTNEVANINGDTLLFNQVKGLGSDYLTYFFAGSGVSDFYGKKVDRIFTEADGYYDEEAEEWVIKNQPSITDGDGNTVYAQPSAQPGDYKWTDVDGDGKITAKDIVKLGNPHPKYLLGINISLNYQIFDLSMFWQGAFGYQIVNGANANLMGYSNANGTVNLPADYVNDHYRDDVYAKDETLLYPANHNAKWSRPTSANLSTFSDIYVEDGSYMRLKNLQIGVRLPQPWLDATTLGDVRFYVSATNLLTFTKYTGLDPEVDTSNPLAAGIDKGVYPNAKVFTAGVSVKF